MVGSMVYVWYVCSLVCAICSITLVLPISYYIHSNYHMQCGDMVYRRYPYGRYKVGRKVPIWTNVYRDRKVAKEENRCELLQNGPRPVAAFEEGEQLLLLLLPLLLLQLEWGRYHYSRYYLCVLERITSAAKELQYRSSGALLSLAFSLSLCHEKRKKEEEGILCFLCLPRSSVVGGYVVPSSQSSK